MSPKPSESDTGGNFAVPMARSDLIETDQLVAQIQILARTQCDIEEAAAFLGLLPEEFARFLAANKRSFHAWFSGPAAGRAGLKMAQFKAAQQGDSRLLVWLGKQHLGQSDKVPTPGDEPPQDRVANSAWDNLSSWRMTKIG